MQNYNSNNDMNNAFNINSMNNNNNENNFENAIEIIRNELITKDNIINELNKKITFLKKQIEETKFLLQQKQNYSPFSNFNNDSNNKENTPSINSNQNNINNNNNNENVNKYNVKSYLQEVKSKVNSTMFKEFIKYMKLITTQKNNNLIKEKIINEVKILFGEKYKELYDKFENVLNIRK